MLSNARPYSLGRYGDCNLVCNFLPGRACPRWRPILFAGREDAFQLPEGPAGGHASITHHETHGLGGDNGIMLEVLGDIVRKRNHARQLANPFADRGRYHHPDPGHQVLELVSWDEPRE